MEWGNASLIAGIVASLVIAAVALYRARPQKDLDENTAKKIELEIREKTAELDRRRTLRLLRLEKYVDEDIQFHREMRDLIAELRDAGLIPKDRALPVPPVLPEMPVNGV